MYTIKLTYSEIDRGFHVYLLENEKEIRDQFFKTEKAARDFVKRVTIN